jgi:anti-sigma factor RsiW
MTRILSLHPPDEELALFTDGLLPERDAQAIIAHLAVCKQCTHVVQAALSGLATLALATTAPMEMDKHARARLWARTRSARPSAAEDLREVSGRGIFPEEKENQASDDESSPAANEPETEKDKTLG